MIVSNKLTKLKTAVMLVGTVIILIIALSSCGLQGPNEYLAQQHEDISNYYARQHNIDSIAFQAMLDVVK